MRRPRPTRRDFLKATGAGVPLAVHRIAADPPPPAASGRRKTPATVCAAFFYPPTETLREAGYFSWPGSSFDAEGRQRAYTARLREIERELGIRLELLETPIDDAAGAARFVAQVAAANADGILLIPFKKSHWTHVMRVVEETKLPAVVLATLGILLVDHINQLHGTTGAHLINSLDNLDAVTYGLRMIRTASRMRQSRILNITGSEAKENQVPHLGTTVRTIPLDRFVAEFDGVGTSGSARDLAEVYRKGAKEIVQPTGEDILDAARTYFALRRLIAAEEADAVMMNCLPGLQKPHRHPPPCMGFMSLRDEGIPAGCQSDLSATLSLMLVQELFDRPGFQQNASMETEKNLYFGAHCTCASKLNGTRAGPEPYCLMSHAEAGWGCVPRVLWRPGQDVTMAQYLVGESPGMHVYSGTVVGCPPIPQTGGCRTNLEMTVNEVRDACEVKGMHQVIFYGDHARGLRRFCRLYGIDTVA